MTANSYVGITERGDASLDLSWKEWVSQGKPTILITKNPEKLHKELYDLSIDIDNFTGKSNIIIHCTITGYGGSVLEPNVPRLRETIYGMNNLLTWFGPERVVLRVDPIIPTKKGLNKAADVMTRCIYDGCERIRISFIDQYNHVRERFAEKGLKLPWDGFHAPLETRKAAVQTLSKAINTSSIEVCGEPGFKCIGCISAFDCQLLGIQPNNSNGGQRKACACLSNKKELLDNRKPCKHGCLYCYWKG